MNFLKYILLTVTTSCVLFAQDSVYVYPNENLVDVNVVCLIRNNNNELNYHYIVKSFSTSQQDIYSFMIEKKD